MIRFFCFLFLFCSVWTAKAQADTSLVDLRDINLRMDEYNFQFLDLDDALKVDPLEVKELYLKGNNSTYPDNQILGIICAFKNLRILIIRDAELTFLPEEISSLKKLQVFIVSGCGLSRLPDNIAELSALRILNLRDNDLETLPASMFRLDNLEKLYLTGNEFQSIPICILSLRNLQTLSISDKSHGGARFFNLEREGIPKLSIITYNVY